ncbi:hypothetical protein, partial [Pseudomonas aeruginosa]
PRHYGQLYVRILSSAATGRAHNDMGIIRSLNRAMVVRRTPGLAPGRAASFVVRARYGSYLHRRYSPFIPLSGYSPPAWIGAWKRGVMPRRTFSPGGW